MSTSKRLCALSLDRVLDRVLDLRLTQNPHMQRQVPLPNAPIAPKALPTSRPTNPTKTYPWLVMRPASCPSANRHICTTYLGTGRVWSCDC